MKWQEHKWTEIKSLDKEMTVVIPLGSIEQHGLHMPLFTDTCQVSAVADRVEAELKDKIVVLPTLWLGSSHHHLDFPGTLSLRPSCYTQVVEELVLSVLSAGFRRVFLLNGHGGNETPIAQALTELSNTDPDAKQSMLAFAGWWQVAKPDADKLQMETSEITHACEYETSLMLYLRPDLIDQKKAAEFTDPIQSQWLEGPKRVQGFRRFSVFTAAGSMGKPDAATAEKGEKLLNAIVADVVEFLEDYATWPLPQQLGPKE